ncbi:hypothetical protein F511_23345 [Dorcoceras hygrometricum]|uniref:Uncharacterized protein n=1 Tax=Dorcoceras hygrometricum TaxID=472368 RepID=A0A2Z7CUR9_9LAMI|nr:hypothetical protein F511_23345 [Dorcoceras hygrometricum]
MANAKSGIRQATSYSFYSTRVYPGYPNMANAKSGIRQATSYSFYSTRVYPGYPNDIVPSPLRITHSYTRGSDLDTQVLLKSDKPRTDLLKPKTKPILTTLPIHLRGVFSKSGLQLLPIIYLALAISSTQRYTPDSILSQIRSSLIAYSARDTSRD